MDLPIYLSKNPKKHLIFDLDETIFLLKLPWQEYKKDTFKILSRFNPELKNPKGYISTNDEINRLRKEFGPEIHELAYPLREKFEMESLQGLIPNGPLINFIRQNKDNFTFHIWTSQMSKTAEWLLKKKKLLDCFDKIVGRDNVDYTKPEPDGFYKIFTPNDRARKSDYIMIGDNPDKDGIAAKKAGIDYFYIDYFKKE